MIHNRLRFNHLPRLISESLNSIERNFRLDSNSDSCHSQCLSIMKRTKFQLFSVAAIMGVALFCGSNTARSAEWINLFDGKSLNGWVQRGGEAKYRIENGEIVGSTVPNTPNSFLCTEKHYANFILEIEYRVDSRMNSGIQIRSHSLKSYKNRRVHGYQVEIDPSDRAW